MSGWQLGIDFGTSYTVAAVSVGTNVTVIDVESNGRSRMPSSVFVNSDGQVLVGTAAQHQASFAPERYEPTPKRSFGEGELFLGDGLVAVTDLAAAVIRRVHTEACRQQGGTTPSLVRLTHPAIWAETRLSDLRTAAEAAGISRYELLPEPVAAAARIGLLTTTPGQRVAVYDFGGGTFDAAVLARTPGGFEVQGRPTGRDPLGGEDIDDRIVDHLGDVLADGNEEAWAALRTPPDAGWRRRAAELRAEVQRAKETLSESTVCQLWLPGLERDAQLTRAELEGLIGHDVDATVDTLEAALHGAGVDVGDLAGVYLTGGSSRIPLVADTIWRRLGVRPEVQDNPKSIVAMGAAGLDLLTAAAADTAAPTITMVVPETGTAATLGAAEATAAEGPAAEPGRYASRLVMAVGVDVWPGGCTCVSDLVVDRVAPPPLTVRVRDEPAPAGSTVEARAAELGRSRAARTPGFAEAGVGPADVLGDPGVERRFAMATGGRRIDMVERYGLGEGRLRVVASPTEAVSIADSLVVVAATAPPGITYESRLALAVPDGWTVEERVVLRRDGTAHRLEATCSSRPAVVGEAAWRQETAEALSRSVAGGRMLGAVPGPVLNHLAGAILTLSWTRDGVPMLTKRGVAVAGRWGYTVTISLPAADQSLFPALARQARLSGAAQGDSGRP